MRQSGSWRIRLALIIGAILVAACAALMPKRALVLGSESHVSLATDWSHRHLIFSAPQGLMQQFQLSNNVRYVQQWARRNVPRHGRQSWSWQPALQGDWNAFLGINSGGTAGIVGAGMYPAKFSFNIGSANCASTTQPDFIVYVNNLAGSATALAARTVGTFTATPSAGQTVVVTSGSNSVTFTGSSTVTSGLFWKVSSTLTTDATNLAAAIASGGAAAGVTATSSGATVTITATTAGTAGNSITVSENVTGLSFPFSGTTTNLVDGATGVPTIVAYDNLYGSCSGTVPSTYWAYNTGTGSTAHTSPVLSGDGSQVAFTQYTGTLTQLVLLKWAVNNGTLAVPVVPTAATNSSYRSCSAPCYTTINFSTANGGANAQSSKSPPFYDYAGDTMFVGDNNGALHKFTGVFLGTPAETISTSGANRWPALLALGTVLTGSVFNEGANLIYVGNSAEVLFRVDATIGGGTGGVVQSADLGNNGFDDGPVVDVSTGNVYVFLRGDNGASTARRAGVFRFGQTFASGSGGSETTVGTNSTLPVTGFYAGDFDNIYYSSSNGTGSMYVCATAGSANPVLWLIPVTAGVLGTAVQGPTLTTASAKCSPVVEFSDGTTDRIFLSVTASGQTGVPIVCPASSGCILAFDVTSTSGWGTSKATSATTSVSGGASGVIIDNSSAVSGASQVYYAPLSVTAAACTTANQQGVGGCAIQASQSGLE